MNIKYIVHFRRINFLIVLIIDVLISSSNCWSQPIWKIDLQGDCKGTGVIQDYDPGYLVSASTSHLSYNPGKGKIFKTDINGGIRYFIELKAESDFPLVLNTIAPASGNCFVVGGGITTDYTTTQPFIIRFNACKEIEWCRRFKFPYQEIQCTDIVMDSTGNFLSLFTPTSGTSSIYVAKISEQGGLIWMNQYCNGLTYRNPVITSIVPTHDGGCVLSGSNEIIPPGSTKYMPQPLWIMVDSSGIEGWNASYIPTVPYYIWSGGTSTRGFEAANGMLYFAGSGGWGAYDAGCFYKLSQDGTQSVWHLVSPTLYTTSDISTTILPLSENHLVLSNAYSPSSSLPTFVISKVDTNGSLLKRYSYWNDRFFANDAIKTADGKILYCGYRITELQPFEWYYLVSLEKYDQSLHGGDYDIIPRLYDSLCSVSITNTTISISDFCSTLSLPDENVVKYLSRLLVFPDPADETISVAIPEYKISTNSWLYVDQYHYEPIEGILTINLYNLNGELVTTDSFDADNINHVMNVQEFPSGIYFLQLLANGKPIASSKFVILHR